jgi:hypothetical protein
LFLLPFGRHLPRQSLTVAVLTMLHHDHVVPAMMTTVVNHDHLLFGVQRR